MNDKLQSNAGEPDSMDRTCRKCGRKLLYSFIKGQYFCNSCDYLETDTYGMIKSILDNNSDLSRAELAAILDLDLGELNEFFDEKNYLVNPRASERNVRSELRSGKRICPSCGTLIYIDSGKGNECPTCGRKSENDLEKVKRFLRDIGTAPTHVISMATGVSERSIEEYLDGEGVEAAEDGTGIYRCKLCGAPVRNGKTCPTCATRELRKLGKIYSDERRKTNEFMGAKWHFSTRRDRKR